jgi:hypothetical protein
VIPLEPVIADALCSPSKLIIVARQDLPTTTAKLPRIVAEPQGFAVLRTRIGHQNRRPSNAAMDSVMNDRTITVSNIRDLSQTCPS